MESGHLSLEKDSILVGPSRSKGHSSAQTTKDLTHCQTITNPPPSLIPATSCPRKYKKLYCMCQQEYKAGILMFQCEGGCEDWYHPACVGISDDQAAVLKLSKDPWICSFCLNSRDSQPNQGQSGRSGNGSSEGAANKRQKKRSAPSLSTQNSGQKQHLAVSMAPMLNQPPTNMQTMMALANPLGSIGNSEDGAATLLVGREPSAPMITVAADDIALSEAAPEAQPDTSEPSVALPDAQVASGDSETQ